MPSLSRIETADHAVSAIGLIDPVNRACFEAIKVLEVRLLGKFDFLQGRNMPHFSLPYCCPSNLQWLPRALYWIVLTAKGQGVEH